MTFAEMLRGSPLNQQRMADDNAMNLAGMLARGRAGTVQQEPNMVERGLSNAKRSFYGDKNLYGNDPINPSVLDSQYVSPEMAEGAVLDFVGGPMTFAGMLKAGKSAGLIKPKWKSPESEVFDMSGLDDPSRFPDVAQESIERYKPARGVPEDVKKAMGSANKKRIGGLLESGLDKGGLGWYNLRPLKDEYIAKFGEQEGAGRFNRFAELVAGTSPRSNVKANIKRASMFQKMMEEGIDPGTALNTSEVGEGFRMPSGYGHLAHKNHRGILSDMLSEHGISGPKKYGRPKITTFAENLKGNLAGATVDTHNKKALTLPYDLKETVRDTEYGFLEDINKDMAKRYGIAPAQAQSSIWAGANEITGVDDARPFMQLMDEAVMRTAKELDVSPQEARDRFLGGKTALYGVGAGFLAPQLLGQDR
jgi:hypothetical protein